MWQRVQTLYIGIATFLIISLFWSDIAKVATPEGIAEHISFTSKWVYLVWTILLTVLQVLALFGYKWRMKQFRVVLVTGIMCIGFQAWLAVDYFAHREMVTYSWTVLIPVVAAVLDFIGARNILLDEAIVQSASRLRSPRNKKRS